MSYIVSVSKIDFPNKIEQTIIKQHVREMFGQKIPFIDRLMEAFDNTEIHSRNFCKPIDYYGTLKNFRQQNDEYISCSLEYSIKAIEECTASAGIRLSDVTDIIFISTTGLATPSLDALIINKLRLNQHINRIPVWGLGCGGGVAGMAKANMVAKANPDAIVLLVTVELCSLTFLKNDFSKSNFIATSLFSDGITASVISGTHVTDTRQQQISIIDSSSKLYYDTFDIMGWDISEEGFKVLFSKDIPTFINNNIKNDIIEFLAKHKLELNDIKNFIVHPGGKKVLDAYAESLGIKWDFLKNSRDVISKYGNMSSSTVIYVLEKFLREGYEDGYGLMVSMGPGFSTEMVLLYMVN